MLASEILTLVSFELNDPSPGVRWPQATTLLSYLNDAQRAVALARPDASANTSSALLVAGTLQTLPAGGLRLLDVTRNMGANGTTSGAAVRLVDRKAFDLYNSNWPAGSTGTAVVAAFYDHKRNPLSYYVTPPVPASPAVYLEVCVSKSPTNLTAVSDAISVSDVYAPALIAWILYRAYSVNTQSQASFQRARSNFEAFAALMGIKTNAEQMDNPMPGAADVSLNNPG